MIRWAAICVLSVAGLARAQDPHAGHAVTADAGSPPGYVPVKIEGGALGGFALTTAVAERRALTRSIRAFGVIAFDETRTSHVHPKVRGTIESVSANFVGKEVKKGDPLAELYSPSVFAAELELASILRQGLGGPRLVQSARRRLQLWDVPPKEIARLVRTRRPARTFTLLAPRDGTVIARQAINGMYVEPGTELFVVSDLSVVWAVIDLFEADVPVVEPGQQVRLAIEAVPEPRAGQLSFLSPVIDEGTRTLKARVVLENPDRALRPGAFVRATLEAPLGVRLAIPQQAVIRTGTRNLVFVVRDEQVEPREVTLGVEAGEWVEVVKGLAEGEPVATQAQFLLDSESRLKATSGPGGPSGHGGH
ncbi:MAG: hypothetical protein H6Q89_4758 [Myxococcaceae bacterium]|nr:hypothetical protein [Myxococcaceae bacterium]